MTRRTKILFLGFCAGERELILKWAESGDMPTVRSLLRRGLSGPTRGLPGFFIGGTWESIATGVTPAKHGIHSWEQLVLGTYKQVRWLTHDNYKVRPFWEFLSQAGRRVAVCDVPLSAYSTDLNGIQLIEWGAHDAQYGFMTSPPSLAKDIVARFGAHPHRGNCDADRTGDEYAEFRDGLLRGIATKTELTTYLLNQGGWDIFLQVFTESHCVGHQCWHLHDPKHPRHDADFARRHGDPVKQVYCAIDRAMGKILDHLEEDTMVVFLAGHGMGPKYQAQFLLDQILLKLGHSAPAAPELPATPRPVRMRDRLDFLLARGWNRLPEASRKALRPWKKRLRAWLDGPPVRPRPVIDPATSLCFPVENNFAHGGIRFNLVGREPQGTVRRGAEYDELFRRLRDDLMEIVNLDTGKPITQRVIRTADMYQGPYLDYLPDVVVEWANHGPVFRIGSPKIGELRGAYQYCRTGEHKPGGLFIAAGPSIPQGTLNRSVSIMDFAPTLSTVLDVDLPDTDGRPIEELVKAAAHAGISSHVGT